MKYSLVLSELREAVSDSRRSVRMLFSAYFLNHTSLIFFLLLFFVRKMIASGSHFNTEFYGRNLNLVLFLALLFK